MEINKLIVNVTKITLTHAHFRWINIRPSTAKKGMIKIQLKFKSIIKEWTKVMTLTAIFGLLTNWSQSVLSIIWIVATIPVVRTGSIWSWSIWTVWCYWWKNTIDIAPTTILSVNNWRIKGVITKCFGRRLRIACPTPNSKCWGKQK